MNDNSYQFYSVLIDFLLVIVLIPVFLGKFDGTGVAKGSVDPILGKLQSLRLHVHSDSENWAILSEVSCFVCCSLGFLTNKNFRFIFKTSWQQGSPRYVIASKNHRTSVAGDSKWNRQRQICDTHQNPF